MIANARMYAVAPEATAAWRSLLMAIIAAAGPPMEWLDYPAPAPLDELWRRTDKGAVFMCGLPFSRALPQPELVAAPVPAPAEFNGEARYWSELVVRVRSEFRTVPDTFGARIAFTVPDSQSGCLAALSYFMTSTNRGSSPAPPSPLFDEIIAPTITPLGALSAVIHGAADIAPIDAYAFRLLQRYRPELTSQVRVVGRTDPTPIPPLVGSAPHRAKLTTAFLEAGEDPSLREMMDALLLKCFVRPDPGAYRVLRDRFEAATAYWRSHSLARLSDPAFAL